MIDYASVYSCYVALNDVAMNVNDINHWYLWLLSAHAHAACEWHRHVESLPHHTRTLLPHWVANPFKCYYCLHLWGSHCTIALLGRLPLVFNNCSEWHQSYCALRCLPSFKRLPILFLCGRHMQQTVKRGREPHALFKHGRLPWQRSLWKEGWWQVGFCAHFGGLWLSCHPRTPHCMCLVVICVQLVPFVWFPPAAASLSKTVNFQWNVSFLPSLTYSIHFLINIFTFILL